MTQIHIQFTRFSAFYSPLILTIAGGYLKDQGLAAEYSISPPGKSAIEALLDGSAHVVQSAVSQGISALERGETLTVAHFAQINEKDGFFLTARAPDPEFIWSKLAGKQVLVDHGGTRPSARARATTSISRARRRNSSNTTALAISSRLWAMRSAPAPSPAWRQPASG